MRRADAAHPHPRSTAAQLTAQDTDAVESLVFDNQGNYYVASHPSSVRLTPAGVEPWAYIVKYDPQGTELARYQVPFGDMGVDWIDLGSDNRTLYYTSETDEIFIYRPALLNQAGIQIDPEFFDVMTVHESTAPLQGIGGTMYALRALPPTPGDLSLRPSGFMIAHGSGPIRVDANGTVLMRYETPGSRGFFFGLNVAPDGQSFWTVTTTNDATPTAQLSRYRISTRDPTLGPVETIGQSSWGLCVKREWTAAINACYETDSNGNAVLVEGQPVRTICRVPEICGNGVDDDSDLLVDGDDPDCRRPGTPVFIAPRDQTNFEGDLIALQLQGEDPEGQPLTYTISGLPPGLSMTPQGLITGRVAWNAATGAPYGVQVTVTDPTGKSASGRFQWTIVNLNAPPTLANPGNQVCALGFECPITYHVGDADRDSVHIEWTGVPAWFVSPPRFAPSNGQTNYTFSTTGVPLTVEPSPSKITTCIKDDTIAADHAPVCQTFTVTVVNHPPSFDVAPQSTLINTFVTLSIGATDSDKHTIAYVITGLPSGLTYEPATGVISGTPVVKGVSNVTVKVTDSFGAATTKTFTWTIFTNRAPVCATAGPTQALWPPNHKMVNVGVVAPTDPDGDKVTVTITDIQQDEPPNGLGDGNTTKTGLSYYDGYVDVTKRSAWVRAERTGNRAVPGDGRIYEIFYTASDGQATCSGSIFTGVPHDQGGRSVAIDSNVRWNSITGERIR